MWISFVLFLKWYIQFKTAELEKQTRGMENHRVLLNNSNICQFYKKGWPDLLDLQILGKLDPLVIC